MLGEDYWLVTEDDRHIFKAGPLCKQFDCPSVPEGDDQPQRQENHRLGHESELCADLLLPGDFLILRLPQAPIALAYLGWPFRPALAFLPRGCICFDPAAGQSMILCEGESQMDNSS